MVNRRPGRPRSEIARRAIIDSALALTNRDGYGRVTIEAIAHEAGVSKQTVYRWWPTKAAIVLEALNERAAQIAPLPDTGALESDLRRFLRRTVVGANTPNRLLLAGLMAAAQLDETFGDSFREDFLAHRRETLCQLLERARARGDLPDAANADFLAELAFAALWYRILARHQPLDSRFADGLTDTLLTLATVHGTPVRSRPPSAAEPA
jgi:AcrR family transcriptional regulator